MVILWYGLVPMAGGLVKRYKWYIFRKRFDELRLSPLLDYSHYRQISQSRPFRFVGGFESVTEPSAEPQRGGVNKSARSSPPDGQTLWIRGDDLTIPVSLKNAETYLLPMQKGESIPEIFDPSDEAPERIRWERVSTLTEGARVFVGGLLVCKDDRWNFVSTKENPLIVIFYDGPDHSLTTQAIRAGRQRGEYWNAITPYSLVIGALCQIVIAALFLSRPAFRLTVIVSIIALFTPLYPIIPPGLLLTVLYRRFTWRSRILRAYSDLARLPLRYLGGDATRSGDESSKSCILPNGERYGFIQCDSLPPQAQEGKIPLLLPEFSTTKGGGPWYIFGALRPGEDLPSQPADPFATFGILPGKPKILAGFCTAWAYILEMAAWIALFAGIGLNIFLLGRLLL